MTSSHYKTYTNIYIYIYICITDITMPYIVSIIILVISERYCQDEICIQREKEREERQRDREASIIPLFPFSLLCNVFFHSSLTITYQGINTRSLMLAYIHRYMHTSHQDQYKKFDSERAFHLMLLYF